MRAAIVLLATAAAGLLDLFEEQQQQQKQLLLVDRPLWRPASSPPVLSRLNFSSPAPHLFASAYGLLQQWSNTIFPNGYAIAACTIPAYTLLYHGRLGRDSGDDDEDDDDDSTPASPEWLALDLEMAYGIMGATRHSWMLTYQTTRPVRLLYFDGESATLMGLGQLDAQMLLLYGNVSGPSVPDDGDHRSFAPLGDEYARARGLCDWLADKGLRGRGWGYEGVVRMNAGFEIIWCDFLSDSLRLLSRLNVTAPLEQVDKQSLATSMETSTETYTETSTKTASTDSAEGHAASYYPLPPVPTRTDRVADPSVAPAPPNWRRPSDGRGGEDGVETREPFLAAQAWGWFASGTWHYGSSRAGPGGGETRLRIDSCAIFSFYAPRFDHGPLALARAAEERAALNLTADGRWNASHAADAPTNRTRMLSQLARRRRFHHLGDASADEAIAMRHRIEEALLRRLSGRDDAACSGAEWTLILAEIVQRTAGHLKMMQTLLANETVHSDSAGQDDETRAWLHRLRAHSHMFMVGYLEYPTSGSVSAEAWQPYSALFNRTLAFCRYRYTRLLVPEEEGGPARPLSPEEADMRWAVEETYGTLCEELLRIGFEVEQEWTTRFGGQRAGGNGGDEIDKKKDKKLLPRTAWADRLAELIAWLGWEGEFLGCSRVCDWHERCFIPMWPMNNKQWGGGRGPGRGPGRGGPRPPGDRYGFPGRPGGGNHTDPFPFPGPPNSSHGRPGFQFPRSPVMMGDETDLWEPKCVEAWYITEG